MAHLKGDELAAFIAAMNRAAVDFGEMVEIGGREPESAEEWLAVLRVQMETWLRLGASIADMVEAATGESVHHFFRPEGMPK